MVSMSFTSTFKAGSYVLAFDHGSMIIVLLHLIIWEQAFSGLGAFFFALIMLSCIAFATSLWVLE